MKPTRALLTLVLCLSGLTPYVAFDSQTAPTHVLAQLSEGPTIEWYEVPENWTLVFNWDGEYRGQTEEVWTHEHCVNDSDGVHTVIFRYRWFGESEWMNQTATRIEGNETTGFYQSDFTYAVWWNYTTGRPETEGSGGNYYYKVWANDTLGNWNEVKEIGYNGGYLFVNPPPDVEFWRTVQKLLPAMAIVIGSVVLSVVVVVKILKTKPAE